MQFYGALILLMTLSAACSLRCYSCTATEAKSCTDTKSCAVIFNKCYTLKVEGLNMVTKGCLNSLACLDRFSCCEGDLCNSGVSAGPSVLLVLLSSAFFTVYHLS
ncbi:prostate stem cell antigen-like [Kryptolebias marmoratus]|uniref:prostate stem cell antigen-like n=1 Tax=Kryptolebias marmoratus TaxID=37003 RepID=UPI0007F89857|nr:prostate stem cell antigen-like [Kryptolebias marmoratus]